MKMKKVQVLRPEVEITIQKPIIGHLKLLTIMPRCLKFIKMNMVVYDGRYREKGLESIYFICIPKFKVVDSG